MDDTRGKIQAMLLGGPLAGTIILVRPDCPDVEPVPGQLMYRFTEMAEGYACYDVVPDYGAIGELLAEPLTSLTYRPR